MESSSRPQTPTHFGPALAATFLLRDYENYGLSERVRYHFHLSEVLGDSATLLTAAAEANTTDNYREDNLGQKSRDGEVIGSSQRTGGARSGGGGTLRFLAGAPCGIARVLECIPTVHHSKLSRQQRLFLKSSLVQLNQRLETFNHPCCEPTRLPLRLNATSRVSFAYETTRIVLLVDGSPSMTATFGVAQMDSKKDSCVCPMDRLPEMASTLIHALAEKVPLPYRQGFWQPKLSFTVLAVYPAVAGDNSGDRTSLLVRDWTVSDTTSAATLVKHLKDWVFGTVEEEIASRIMRRNAGAEINLDSFSEGSNLKPTSFSDWLQAGQAALDALTSAARPCVIVATDGRSICSDRALDDLDNRDIPLFVLDLSSPVQPRRSVEDLSNRMQSMMQKDHGADFPLYMSDDREALFHICQTTGGCLWDKRLLDEAAKTNVGHVASDSILAVDQYLGKLVRKHQPHMIRPNAVQWYTLFSLSPLSPTFYANWGHLPPPAYLRQRLNLGNLSEPGVGRFDSQSVLHSQSTLAVSASDHRKTMLSTDSAYFSKTSNSLLLDQRKSQVRVQFSTYFINPVRILGLLMMRVKEGYRAIRYGQSTHDPDKVSIIFHLPLELGTSLFYEASYRSLPGHNHMVGHAHIKIELSGEASFVQTVKTDFLQHNVANQRRPVTLAQQVSAKLGRLLRSIRREDLLQSYLSPVKWSDPLLKTNSPFLRRLGTLSKQQKLKHFRYDEFDCVCVGRMPYAQDTDFLGAFQDSDTGEEDLLDAISSWATQRVQSGHRDGAVTFIRKLGDGRDGLPAYCLLSVERSRVASRLYTVSVEIFEGASSAPRRLGVLESLREMIAKLKDVRVLEMQMGPFLMGFRRHNVGDVDERKESFLSSQYLHESWDLVYDKELLPLLMRRRAEIGGFWLLDSSESYALFARLHSKDGFMERRRDDQGDMVQYQVSILADRVVIDLHMESECGVFRNNLSTGGQFETLVTNLKRRDQECGLALRARTHVLSAFEDDPSITDFAESYAASAMRLLEYSSRVEQRLRGFHPMFAGANDALLGEFKDMLLGQRFGPKVALLSIDSVDEGQPFGPGLWFLINYDKNTFGILNVGSSSRSEVDESGGCSLTTTTLTFYTLSISDLYSRREDFVGDDDSEQGTVEEYMCMSDFAEQLSKEYEFVYTRAAYRALLRGGYSPFSIHLDDMVEVMSPLKFCPVANVLVESGGEKLVEILSSVVHDIPGENYYHFFKLDEDAMIASADFSSVSSSDNSADDDGDLSQSSDEVEETQGFEARVIPEKENEIDSNRPPIFVRFLLDGVNASMDDLIHFRKSANLVSLISVYNETSESPMNLPLSHRTPAGHIKRLLDAYVAEQTLERLRHHGRSIHPDNLRLARKCLRRARDVLTLQTVLKVYSLALDTIVSASISAGSDGDIETGMRLLQEELLLLEGLKLGRINDNSFVVFGGEGDANLLPYWCFLDFGIGVVSIETHHSAGPEHARNLLSSIHAVIIKRLHRVNQLLILRRLHKNRTATPLMIPQDDKAADEHNQSRADDDNSEGSFACPIVFRKRFELFHRCATNPEQVARTVETSVLHVFSLSNRRRVFVYKDESESIFYMKLSTTGGGLEPDGIIDLEVYGVEQPTESVTKQLSRLISRKILSIAVDLLAAVLTKNPRYAWRPADVSFVVDYNDMFMEGEADSGSGCSMYYSLPLSVSDPSTLLLYFRQNLCGSTYFHPFIASSARDESADDIIEPRFAFYYNNIPSKLSPKLQVWSTLTEKGAEFARLAGQGLALVEVALVDSSETFHRVLQPSDELEEITSEVIVVDDSMRVRHEARLGGTSRYWIEQGRLPTHFIKVTITDTALRRKVLHDWVRLTLDQVTTGWVIERQVERQQRGLLRCSRVERPSDVSSDSRLHEMLDNIVPGLPALQRMYTITNDLPHPAVRKVRCDGMVRASSVASVALKLLELIFDPIRRETKGSSRVDFFGLVNILRLSRNSQPKLVRLSWARDKRSCLVHPSMLPTGSAEGEDGSIVDSHIDCPHYLISFSSPEYGTDSKDDQFLLPKLFEGVNVGDEYKNETRLAEIKERIPNRFKRSFGFFLSVKRNSRFVLSYNWRADLFAAVESTLKKEDASLIEAAARNSDVLQRRSLSFLSPPASAVEPQNAKVFFQSYKRLPGKDVASKQPQRHISSSEHVPKEMNRRAVRPTSIRKPKLVGKSVDGSAYHAVAASRARAAFKGSYGSSVQPSGPGGNSSTQTPTLRSKVPPRKTRNIRSNDETPQTTQEGRRTNRVIEAFRAKATADRPVIRQHTLHQHATQAFLGSLWPYKTDFPILSVGAEFLISQTNLEDVKTVELLPFPSGMFETFTIALATFLKQSDPDLRIVATSKKDTTLPPAVFLSVEPRKMKCLKCFPVLQLDMVRDRDTRRLLLRCATWTVALNRPSKTKSIGGLFHSRQRIEMRASGPDKLATTVLSTTGKIETKLIEFALMSAVNVFRKNGIMSGPEAVKLVFEVQSRYDLERQIQMLRSDYKAFRFPLILRSFGQPRIDRFATSVLFDWLVKHAEARGLFVCTIKSLLLPSALDMPGTQAFSLISDLGNQGELDVTIVCHAKGVDLQRFMFRPDSNVALTRAKSLAIDAAGVALCELYAASTSLRLHSLWNLVLHDAPRPHQEESFINELLGLCVVEPLQKSIKGHWDDLYDELFDKSVDINWSEMCDSLSLEDSFSPSWALTGGRKLFFMRTFDVFLLVTQACEADPVTTSFVLKSASSTSEDKKVGAAQQLMNCLLNCLWHTVAEG